MKSFKERAEAIRSILSPRERFAEVLNTLNIEVDRTFKFTLRDERTSSIQIYNSGTAFDFGAGGERIDMVDIVAQKDSLSSFDALKKVEDMLGISQETPEYKFTSPVLVNSSNGDTEYDDTPLKESYIKYFRDQLIKNRGLAQKHLLKLLPVASDKESEKLILAFEIGYDKKNDKLTIPVRSIKDGHIMNLMKYTSEPMKDIEGKAIPKVKYLYGRRRTIFNLGVLKRAPKVLYILEGEKDVLNAELSGKSAITQGASSGWRKWMPQALIQACKKYNVDMPKIVILQDHDEAGVKATLAISESLKTNGIESKMFFWKQTTAKKIQETSEDEIEVGVVKIEPQIVNKGFDYTDYCNHSSTR